MTKVNKADFEAVDRAIRAVAPPDWDMALVWTPPNRLVLTIKAAPVDLLAQDRAVCGDAGKPGYSKVCPTPWEDYPESPIYRLWQALLSQNTVEFERGRRVGRWFAAELWIGNWRRPFKVLGGPQLVDGLQTGFANL